MLRKNKHIIVIILVHLVILTSYFTIKNWDRLFQETEIHSMIQPKTDFSKLTITYSMDVQSLEPTLFDDNTKARLTHIYEPLIRFDENLNIKPALALSWGKIDDLTYEFHLRPNVTFHNGDSFDADDVLKSYNRAISYKQSGIRTLFAGIEEIEKVNDLRILVKIKDPDPLLLEKFANLYILPKRIIDNSTDADIAQKPIGTGPYRFSKWDKKNFLELVANKNYYKGSPLYEKLFIRVIPNRYARILSVRENETDILLNVPPSFVQQAEKKFGYDIKLVPSLESLFLLFNFNNEYLQEKNIREAIALGLDEEKVLKLGGQYTLPLNQFVSSGVFGYNPEIQPKTFDIEKALENMEGIDLAYEGSLIDLDLALTEDNGKLGELIKRELEPIGFNINLVTLPPNELLANLSNGESDLYLLGWRFNTGDIDELYKYVVHSKTVASLNGGGESLALGRYNGISYSNDEVDQMIKEAAKELDEKKRLKLLQNVMKIITEDDIIGIPLFESEKIYAIRKGIDFIPRIDGLVQVF